MDKIYYSHRNGEEKAPTEVGNYWFIGIVEDEIISDMVTVLKWADSEDLIVIGADSTSDLSKFEGKWYGPIVPPWEMKKESITIYTVWQTDGYDPYAKYSFLSEDDANLCAEVLKQRERKIVEEMGLSEYFDDDFIVVPMTVYESYDSWEETDEGKRAKRDIESV